MDLRLGMPVVSAEGRQLGSIDRIILEPDTHEVFGIISHKGRFLSDDRVIEVGFIESTDGEAVHLRLTAERADRLPRFVEHEFVAPTPEELRSMPYPVDGGVSGAGATVLPIMWRSTYSGHGFEVSQRSLLESSSADAAPIEVLTNLPDDALLVSKGTDVITQDGKKVGRVDDILFSDDTISGVMVRTGLIHHHDISVPVSVIESITDKHVRLRVTHAEFDAMTPSAASPTQGSRESAT
jgi:uncharacterized protein YrrD